MKQKLFLLVKILSTGLITSAIGLELWNIQSIIANASLPNSLYPLLILSHLALSAHFVEAIIAAVVATGKNKMPLTLAAYTFFVGTVGLLEMWENQDN
ncbi:hypothetical protein B6N60_01887 [Richelia sinica FACHB-800]|uniref:Uncharacterized protein n=1 Tax=Richelia sinica FACHB-800 TaxID=1357546 RepID=A0A975T852_9NOST|nr:hypothetical protein [Richelia sinica]MBD2664701.1 hypothetical protein [Richelia sinica FACHB-800]QXE23198.1 hypothetical protein B6N60_01887 [Richelia sinica FACHB-800]